MTQVGICHNATFEKSRMGVGEAKRLLPARARTITYWREDQSSWRATLDNCRDLAEMGCHILIVFNTEAWGGNLLDLNLLQQRLRAFLALAKTEYAYVDHQTLDWRLPIHSLEPLNEIDTPGWDDGAGGLITPSKVINLTFAFHEVATQEFGVETISPSFLGGPTSELPVSVLSSLASDRSHRITTAAFHMYGRSILGQPYPGWIWGSVEDGIDDLLGYIGDMQIDLTEGGCWSVDAGLGQQAQARFVNALCSFEHPRVRSSYLFAHNDWCPAEGEYQAGKDFGLVARDGTQKLAYADYYGGLSVRLPKPTPETPGPDYTYVLGFRKFAAALAAGGVDPGAPMENEFGPWDKWSMQRAEHGWFQWANLQDVGGRLAYLADDGRRFRYDESWPTFEQVLAGRAAWVTTRGLTSLSR